MATAPVSQPETGTVPAGAPDLDGYYKSISSRYRAAKYLTVAALVMFLIFSFTFMRNEITIENLRYLMKFISFTNTETSITVAKINYSSGDPNRLELFIGDLATLTPSGYAIYDSRGNQIMAEDITYSSPVLKVGAKFALCYDMGGNEYTLLNTFAKLVEGTTEYPITDGTVADDGSFAVASSSREYRTMVTLYNGDFEPVSRILKNDHLMGIELRPDGSELAVMTAGAANGAFYTRLEMIRPGADRARISCELDGLGYGFYLHDDGYLVLTDETVYFLDGDMNIRQTVKQEPRLSMTHFSGKYLAVLSADGVIGNRSNAKIYDVSGRKIFEGGFEGKLIAVDSDDSGEYIFILSGQTLTRVNLYNKKIGSITVAEDAIDVLPQSKDSFLLAMKNYALNLELDDFTEAYFDRGAEALQNPPEAAAGGASAKPDVPETNTPAIPMADTPLA